METTWLCAVCSILVQSVLLAGVHFVLPGHCDERVIKDWSAEQKKEYSLVLLSFHVPGKMITVCALAFGEVGVKQRVKGILNFKKPTFWLIAAALLFCVIIGALFLTNPKKNDNVEENIATELSESSLTDQTLNTEKDSLADQESELNALLKKQSDAIRAQQQSFLQTWADAFCDRDGAAIDSLCMDGARKKMMKEQLLVIDEGDTIFGWSSPWPMWDTSDENSKGYTITTSYDGKNTAEILYYAWTSDPHVTVWKEDITFEERDGRMRISVFWIILYQERNLMRHIRKLMARQWITRSMACMMHWL